MKINGNKSKQIFNLKNEFYCYFSLKPDSTVSRQIVVQILGLESPKVCGNLAVPLLVISKPI
jgi:hypothetical protein